MRIVDSHQHFWDPEDGDYAWVDGPFLPIRRVFTPDDLRPELVGRGVAATVLVQTWSSEEETRRFLALAEATDFIAGVVGWVDLTAPDVADRLAAFKSCRGGNLLKGVRHQVHDEADPNWLLRDDVRRGLCAVAAADLVYDLLIKPRELPAAARTVADFPNLRFVVDHIAKPNIAGTGFDTAWAEGIRSLGPHRHHVWCKVSGMVTEADWATWSPATLRPYIDTVLEVFGAGRCLFGSDWPVCRVAGGYARWLDALGECLSARSEAERRLILAETAINLYDLDVTEFST